MILHRDKNGTLYCIRRKDAGEQYPVVEDSHLLNIINHKKARAIALARQSLQQAIISGYQALSFVQGDMAIQAIEDGLARLELIQHKLSSKENFDEEEELFIEESDEQFFPEYWEKKLMLPLFEEEARLRKII